MMQTKAYTLYGAAGWGSVLVEAALTCCGAAYRFEDVTGFDSPGAVRDRYLSINPNAQIPALMLPDGEVMTESAAIILHLAETFPNSGLAPPPGSPERTRFLRRLVWLVASVYPTFTYADYPERWSPEAPEPLKQRVIAYRKDLWRQWEHEGPSSPWAMGERFSALDIYVAAMTRWRPGRDWFEAECPGLFAIAARAEALPVLAPVWTRNFSPQ